MVLDSVFGGRALPGTNAPLSLPDLGFVLRHDNILIADEGMAGSLSGDALPKPMRLMSRAALTSESCDAELAYLKFNNQVLDQDAVRVTLETRLLSGKSDPAGLGLSSVHVVFRKKNGAWTAEEPAVSAA
jgi:hypothetical protein